MHQEAMMMADTNFLPSNSLSDAMAFNTSIMPSHADAPQSGVKQDTASYSVPGTISKYRFSDNISMELSDWVIAWQPLAHTAASRSRLLPDCNWPLRIRDFHSSTSCSKPRSNSKCGCFLFGFVPFTLLARPPCSFRLACTLPGCD
jgi:hypothetical protein